MDELQLHIKALEHGIRQPDTMLVFGFLHRTGPNIENKHHERLFFRWDADYNGPNTKGSIPERYERFRSTPARLSKSTQASSRPPGSACKGMRSGMAKM
jgi:hypothetical protein